MLMHVPGTLIAFTDRALPIYVVLEQPEACPRYSAVDGSRRTLCAYVSDRRRVTIVHDVSIDMATRGAQVLCRP